LFLLFRFALEIPFRVVGGAVGTFHLRGVRGVLDYKEALVPKTRKEKEQLVKDYTEKLAMVKSIILTDFSGLKTKNLSELRNKLFEKGIDYQVVKNRLLLLALKDQKIEIPSEILDRPLALAFSYEDEIAPTKIIYNFAKENEKLEILGGIIDKKFVEPDKIKTLALLPSQEDLYNRLIVSLNMPRYRLIHLLTANQYKLIYILKKMQQLQ